MLHAFNAGRVLTSNSSEIQVAFHFIFQFTEQMPGEKSPGHFFFLCDSSMTIQVLYCARKQKTKEVNKMTPERPPQEILEIIGEFFEWLGW